MDFFHAVLCWVPVTAQPLVFDSDSADSTAAREKAMSVTSWLDSQFSSSSSSHQMGEDKLSELHAASEVRLCLQPSSIVCCPCWRRPVTWPECRGSRDM